MAFERVTAFCLYLSDNMDLIRKPGMTPDQVFEIAEREWQDLIKNNKDIASEYIKKEISINTYNTNNSNQFRKVQFVGMNPFMFNC
jgi:hypothetical protein